MAVADDADKIEEGGVKEVSQGNRVFRIISVTKDGDEMKFSSQFDSVTGVTSALKRVGQFLGWKSPKAMKCNPRVSREFKLAREANKTEAKEFKFNLLQVFNITSGVSDITYTITVDYSQYVAKAYAKTKKEVDVLRESTDERSMAEKALADRSSARESIKEELGTKTLVELVQLCDDWSGVWFIGSLYRVWQCQVKEGKVLRMTLPVIRSLNEGEEIVVRSDLIEKMVKGCESSMQDNERIKELEKIDGSNLFDVAKAQLTAKVTNAMANLADCYCHSSDLVTILG